MTCCLPFFQKPIEVTEACNPMALMSKQPILCDVYVRAWTLHFFLCPLKKIHSAKHIMKQYRLIKSCGRAARQGLCAPLTAKLSEHPHCMYVTFSPTLPCSLAPQTL